MADDDDTKAGTGGTFTQADLDRIAGERAASARTAEANRVAAALGMSVEDAAAKLKAAAETERAALSAGEQLAAAKADAEAARREAAETVRVTTAAASARVALVSAGVTSDQVEAVLRMVDTGPEAKPATEQVEALKASIPALFAGAGSTGPVGTPAGDKAKPQQGTKQTMEERVAANLERLKLGGKK